MESHDDSGRLNGRVMLLGDHLGRLQQLAEAFLRAGCRVELVPETRGPVYLDTATSVALLLIDEISDSRARADVLGSPRTDDETIPLIALVARDGSRQRIGSVRPVAARISAGGLFADARSVVASVLETWNDVRPLFGPGELRIDRVVQRASFRGKQLALRPFDFRLLLEMAESGQRGCTLDELIERAWKGRQVDPRRRINGVRQGLERLRSLFRRTGIAIVLGSDGRYRLALRTTRSA